jgi:hypothetical protein
MQASAPTTATSRDRAQRPRGSTQAPRARSPRSQRQQPLPSTKPGGSSQPAPPPPPRRSSARLSAPISVAINLVHASTLAWIDREPCTVQGLGASSGRPERQPVRSSPNRRTTTRSPNPVPESGGGTTAEEAAAGEGSSLRSLASACAVSQHPAVTGIRAEPAPPAGVAQARAVTLSALFGRLVISWESPGLPRPTPSPGGSSAGTAAMPPSPGSSWREHTGARPSPVLLVCSSRSRSPSPAWDTMAPCSGRPGSPICIYGQIAPPGQRVPPTEDERAGTQIPPAKQGGSRCHRSGQRRIRRQPRRARRASQSRRRRPRAGSNRDWDRPSAESSVRRTRAVRAVSQPFHASSLERRCGQSRGAGEPDGVPKLGALRRIGDLRAGRGFESPHAAGELNSPHFAQSRCLKRMNHANPGRPRTEATERGGGRCHRRP